ncbi:unnamed protein product [Lymnaea stagnalis]|uniref:Sodium/nucleoside cotransporter n=1 Tax=Lymnaea stagnalis TaxID=6523 RepID=A0AAV2I151_LYMST
MAELMQIVYNSHDEPVKPVVLDSTDLNSYDNQAFTPDEKDSQLSNGNGKDTNHSDSDSPVFEPADTDDPTCFSRLVEKVQSGISGFFKRNHRPLKLMFGMVLLAAYFAYFGYAMYYKFGDEGSWRLLVITMLSAMGIILHLGLSQWRKQPKENVGDKHVGDRINYCMAKLRISIILPVLLTIGFIVYIVVDVALDRPENLISLAGMVVFIALFFIFSYNPSKVKWRPVFWGIALQLIFALLILRTSWGHDAFQWLGDRVSEFLAYTDAGSKFIFGDDYEQHYFAFKVLPVVVFFSTCVSMLYYLGVMQSVISLVGRFLAFCLGTSPTESVNAAGNIFIGQTEAPLLIRPFLKDMTNSEIHAVMTGGFATIAGAVMAAYILYKVPANHLLAASAMSAPAALAMSKLFYPETEKSKHNAKDVYNIAKGLVRLISEHNLIEAASNGASMSIKLVANIAVNLIAFVALLQFVNATLTWLGDRVGQEGLTFQFICSYLFWPIAFLMGVEQDDCRTVAELVGTKIFLNEFVAYVDLSVYIKNQIAFDAYLANFTGNSSGNLTGAWTWVGGDIYLNETATTLTRGLISDRSVVIATYALCGFSNISSMGIQLGALGAMAPNRKGDLSKIVFRAMLAGNVACFLTACIAGENFIYRYYIFIWP